MKPQAEPIRAALAASGSTAISVLAEAEPADVDGISDRAADCWEPLLAIAELAGGEWPERARNAAVELSGDGNLSAEDSPRGIRLLSDIHDVFDASGEDRMRSEALARALSEIEESLWDTEKGKAFDARALARELRLWKIRPKQIRFSESESVKGYMRTPSMTLGNGMSPENPGLTETVETTPIPRAFSTNSSAETPESRFDTKTREKPFDTNDVSVVSDNRVDDENGGVMNSNRDEPAEEPGDGNQGEADDGGMDI